MAGTQAKTRFALWPGHDGEGLSDRSSLREQLVDVVPVHQMIDERLEVVGPAVAVVDVVGMLPDIDAENRRGAVHQRIFAVRGLGDFEFAILDGEPGPTG